MNFSRLVAFSALCVPLALSGCGQETTQSTSEAATTASSAVATSVAPAVTQAPVPVVTMPPDTRTQATEADKIWITETLPVVQEVDAAIETFGNTKSSSAEEAATRVRVLKASLMQCRSKLLVAPRSSNFTKAHTLLFDGVNQAVTGADLILLGISFNDTPAGKQSMQDGGDKLLAGGELLDEGVKAAREALAKLRD